MIHHYINLVCWRPMMEIYDPMRDHVWVDSVSLKLLVARVRDGVEYRPGTTILSRMGVRTKDDNGWFFLTAQTLSNVPQDIQFKLPLFDDVHVPDNLADALNGLSSGTRIAIGISAPKQNLLAVALHALRPDLEYHCLGAAVADLDKSQPDAIPRKSVLAGSGFEWLRFLLTSPRRTWNKIVPTVREAVIIMKNGRQSDDFKRFAAICAPALLADTVAQTPSTRI